MCRLLITTTRLTRAGALKFIRHAANTFANTQRDGFGFAAFDKKGQFMARGRYYDAYHGWGRYQKGSESVEEGELTDGVQTLIAHGRTSTNVLGVDYCHPYVENDTYLAHNGVLSWKGPGEEEPTHPNDSAAFLQWLESREFPNPRHWSKYWSGYGAIAFVRPGEGLTVCKCNRARLTLTPAEEGGHILSTSPSDVPHWLRKRGSMPRWMNPGIFEFSRKSGDLVRVRNFGGFASRVWDDMAARAFESPTPYKQTYQETFEWDETGRD